MADFDERVQQALVARLADLDGKLQHIKPSPLRVNTMTLSFHTDLPQRSLDEMRHAYADALAQQAPRKPFKNCVILRTVVANERGPRPRTIATKVFCNGVLHVTGASTLQEACDAVHATLGPDVDVSNFNVQLLTAVFDMGASLNLMRLSELLTKDAFTVSFNKEKYSGLIARPPQSRTATVLFGSGKGMVTGARTVEDLLNAYTRTMLKIDAVAGQVLEAQQPPENQQGVKRKRGRRPKALVTALYAEMLGECM